MQHFFESEEQSNVYPPKALENKNLLTEAEKVFLRRLEYFDQQNKTSLAEYVRNSILEKDGVKSDKQYKAGNTLYHIVALTQDRFLLYLYLKAGGIPNNTINYDNQTAGDFMVKSKRIGLIQFASMAGDEVCETYAKDNKLDSYPSLKLMKSLLTHEERMKIIGHRVFMGGISALSIGSGLLCLAGPNLPTFTVVGLMSGLGILGAKKFTQTERKIYARAKARAYVQIGMD